MNIDFSWLRDKLTSLENEFNTTDDPIRRFAIIQAINHIAEHELPFKKDHWIYDTYYKESIRSLIE